MTAEAKTSTSAFKPRLPAKVAVPTSMADGAGVRLKRSVGGPALPVLDPFLLLDEFRSDDPGDYIAGFPSHPHRGFETVTIMLAGAMEHKDSVGNTGHLGPGSVQWMTAGRGIIHSEMPKQENGLMWGFQIWVNLPAQHKMTAPRYQDIPAVEIPTVEVGDVKVRVVAGTVADTTGPIEAQFTEAVLLDVTVPEGETFEHPLPTGHNVVVYPIEGSVRIADGDEVIERSRAVVLDGDGDGVQVTGADGGGRFLVLAGKPLNEPVARYGPFVMNTKEELYQAFEDYKAGRLA